MYSSEENIIVFKICQVRYITCGYFLCKLSTKVGMFSKTCLCLFKVTIKEKTNTYEHYVLNTGLMSLMYFILIFSYLDPISRFYLEIISCYEKNLIKKYQ